MQNPSKQLGQNIRYLRRDRNITQSSLAKQIGYHQTEVSRFELGKGKLDAVSLFAIASAFNCSVEDLNPFGTKDKKKKLFLASKNQ